MSATAHECARRVGRLLARTPPLTVAVAESLTCGRIQAALGAISGASEYFLGGITAYALEAKVRHLGVDRAEAERCDAVSAAVAAQMAVGASRLFGSDFAVATTGYAEPGRGIAAPLAFFAVARRGAAGVAIVREGRIERAGVDRVGMQAAVTEAALTALEEAVLDARG